MHYEMCEIVGEGAYGKVYRAICKKTGEDRAIKVLKGKFMKEQNRKELLSELTLLSKLQHPSIVTLYDLFFYNNKYYPISSKQV